MSGSPNTVSAWQDYYRTILMSDDRVYQSASGTKYTGEQVIARIDDEIDSMSEGEYPKTSEGDVRSVPRIEDEDGNYILRDAIDQEWYDLISEGRYGNTKKWVPGETARGDTFTQYFPEERGQMPHQGWKVRVAAYAEEARPVANAVLPYLQENDINHKVMQDVHAFNNNEGGRQEGKFITIYPEIDDDRKDTIMEDRTQVFKRNDPSWNEFSINSNTKNAQSIIQDLEEELDSSYAISSEGRSINGKNGEEKQYSNTRIHFRYAHHFNTPAKILDLEESTEEVDNHEGLVNKKGELITGSYIGDQIDAATRPDKFLY